ncbi:MAG: hypothetical protein NXI12_01205 [Alphaproteobacteria bacterium]|nr:hypothetical protein [Alphaproteobacteria bacterium]
MMVIAALSALSLQAMVYPDCSEPELEPRVACALDAGDGTGWRLVFEFDPEGPRAREVDILVVAVDGAPVQRLSYPLERGFLPPELTDLDGDGLDDLLLPLSTGMVNSEWRIAFGTGDGFADAEGEPVYGHTVEAAAPGLFAVHARGSAGRHDVAFHARDGLAIPVEATVAITFDEEGAQCALITQDAPRPEEVYCSAAMSN